MVLLIICLWVIIGMVTWLIEGVTKKSVNTTWADLFICMLLGAVAPLVVLLINLEEANKLPNWMTKDVFTNLK